MQQSRARVHEDRIVGLLILACSAAYGRGAWEMSGLRSDDFVGPAGFPSLIAAGGIGLSAWLVFKPQVDVSTEPLGGVVWLYWATFVVYAGAMPIVGFGITSAVFLAATFIVLRAPAWRAIMVAVLATSALLLVFNQLFGLRLSIGPWS